MARLLFYFFVAQKYGTQGKKKGIFII